jgi:adenine-specific DNA-methyltransferase
MKIMRTELVWPGKYDEKGDRVEPPRRSLPFQVIETVNVSRASREAASRPEQRTLFDYWDPKEGTTFEEGWRNKLIWGDNLLVMNSLMERFEGKVDLIYIDPPFATGADFSTRALVGDDGSDMFKDASLLEETIYRDTWAGGIASYLDMLAKRLVLMRSLLSDDGSIYIHLDWHVGHYVKLLLDEVFGEDNFRNEIVWHYYNKFQGNVNRFASDHDVIFWYSKSEKYAFKTQKEARPEGTVRQLKRAWNKETGRIVNVKGSDGKVVYVETSEKTVDDVWRISMLQPADRTQNLGFPTQKPETILERIINTSSSPSNLVADFFCGSGTTQAVAERLGRRWIGVDVGRFAIHTTRKRLLDIERCRPFEVLNLGRYERQYWQGATFGKDGKDVTEQAIFQYLAFVLKLYKAEPLAGMQHLHGRRAGAMVHIGAVDAPVTIDEITHALDECAALKQKELHVLGWEWEMGLAGPNNDVKTGGLMHQTAKERGIKLVLLQIPREVMEEQAAQKGDVQFFELAYLDVAITKPKKLNAVVGLKAFVIPNTDLIPEEVRAKVTKWSDYIDYWSVDWDFQNDTFIQGFVTYRTRKSRKLLLVSDPHPYEKHGKHHVVVKVIDIFGNDTSQGYTVEV